MGKKKNREENGEKMNKDNTNWSQSVAGVVIRDNKVLLARHTYGNGKGMLIIPGGYVNFGESPQDALIREFKEETNITIEPKNVIGIRFNIRDWYVVFNADYVSGDASSDNDENSEVVWIDVDTVLSRDDVPDLTKKMIQSSLSNKSGLKYTVYEGGQKNAPYSLYSANEKV